ncbi:hypothetical protein Lfu02_57880 [Longispora fulva]|uniref:Immunity protein Imm1 n=1 Tax=Longispora fulva TaxID=619741 RepID=A0A8J7GG51_9ACTN|nr:Imm1 family immunity protein [Longispora fulva]MBG6137231.1 hypothetical protein [Longispora fulva]GIG61416.1 hypothetical protein Lfu02_57880 [Longispora fulva]
MRLVIEWGTDPYVREPVETLAELDAALSRATAALSEDGLPVMITLYNPEELTSPDGIHVGLFFGVGPERATVQWSGKGESLQGFSPEVKPWDGEPIEFDFGGVPTEETPETVRVLPAAALQAARQFTTTGERPACLEWLAV